MFGKPSRFRPWLWLLSVGIVLLSAVASGGMSWTYWAAIGFAAMAAAENVWKRRAGLREGRVEPPTAAPSHPSVPSHPSAPVLGQGTSGRPAAYGSPPPRQAGLEVRAPGGSPPVTCAPAVPTGLATELRTRVIELKAGGRTVEAIEVLREATGMELYEASQVVRKLGN